jgi:uncharacterized delta-60 repeat protein
VDLAYSVAVQWDGRILAGGSWLWDAGDAPCCFLRDFFLARYNPDGSLDSGFGDMGKVSTDINREDHVYGVAIRVDGKIVAAGCARGCFLPTPESDFGLARYNPDGSLDNTFSADGKVTTDFAGDEDQARSVAIQADGKIVAAGSALISGSDDFALARYKVCRVSSRRSSIPCR